MICEYKENVSQSLPECLMCNNRRLNVQALTKAPTVFVGMSVIPIIIIIFFK